MRVKNFTLDMVFSEKGEILIKKHGIERMLDMINEYLVHSCRMTLEELEPYVRCREIPGFA